MKEFTLIQIRIPADINYSLDKYLLDLNQTGAKINKADLVVKLMAIGLLSESEKLNEYLEK